MATKRTGIWLTVVEPIEFEPGKILRESRYAGFVEETKETYQREVRRRKPKYILMLTPKQRADIFGPENSRILTPDTIDVTKWVKAGKINVRRA